ncbi:hypothetical protein HaLaN_31963 [Haematococcus lacustris]|uniref:Uncharacterized protein n=1 Tax=Haematococcus lacustris TaxID=44745 RepID=A0A6A0AK86_HAELA|nr:hypothetical protein HaLaN_31963 [Haematococcus lacustris]
MVEHGAHEAKLRSTTPQWGVVV